MLAQIQIYAVIGLTVIIIALCGTWYVTNRIKTAEMDTLQSRNAVLATAVEMNERTIQQMVVDAQVLAQSNQKLTSRIVTTEMEFVDEWAAINALDLESDQAVADVAGLETKINNTFAKSVEDLRSATDRMKD